MAKKSDKLTITEQIDADEGLASKRKLLTLTSLVLLALSFSGAKVEEANTLILKLSFENQTGLSTLLVVAIVFLLIRYYNYAYKYHRQLYLLWSDRMLRHPFFFSSPHEVLEYFGYVIDRAPDVFDIEAIRSEGGDCNFSYQCRFPFRRVIVYSWHDEYFDENEVERAVEFKQYFKVLKLEVYFQVSSYFTHRENLDITLPYILGVTAICSYFFNDSLQAVLTLLSAG